MMAREPVPNVEQLLKRTLAEAKPPRAATARIVAGAMLRTEPAKSGWQRWVPAMTVLAGLGVLVWFGNAVWLRPTTSTSAPAVVMAVALTPGWQALGLHAVELSVAGSALVEAQTAKATRLQLNRGRLTCAVAKLGPGESFAVQTPQVQVRVVGTRFVVELEGDCTWVRVHEGTVWVTSVAGDRSLTIGQEEKFCAPPPVPALAATAGGEWVREALTLIGRNQGPDQAAQLLSRYLTTYPGGVFEEEALFYLCILKQQAGDHIAARDLAERFWATFPEGRRARELRRLLGDDAMP